MLLAIFSALTGKTLSELGLEILDLSEVQTVTIAWWLAFLSAFVGSFSHVFLDSIMHTDVQPFYPVTLANDFHGMVSVEMLHKLCLYSGFLGALVYYVVNYRVLKCKHDKTPDA